MSTQEDLPANLAAYRCGQALHRVSYFGLQVLLLYAREMTTRVCDDLNGIAETSRDLTPNFETKNDLTTHFRDAAKSFQNWRESEAGADETERLNYILNSAAENIAQAIDEELSNGFGHSYQSWTAKLLGTIRENNDLVGYYHFGQFSDRLRRPSREELINRMTERLQTHAARTIDQLSISPSERIQEDRVQDELRFRNAIDEVSSPLDDPQCAALEQRWRELELPTERLSLSTAFRNSVELADWVDEEIASLLSPVAVASLITEESDEEVATPGDPAANDEELPTVIRQGRWSYSRARGELTFDDIHVHRFIERRHNELFARLFANANQFLLLDDIMDN